MGRFDQARMSLNLLCLVSLQIIIPDHWTRPNHHASMLFEQRSPAPTPPPPLAQMGDIMYIGGQMPHVLSQS